MRSRPLGRLLIKAGAADALADLTGIRVGTAERWSRSAHGWHEKTADPWPWLGYFTSLIASAYAVFADRAAAARTPGTKQERVREHILRHART
jgi:hypothetical protein